ncbi:redoxin domain-containing protein [Telluribacter humicola]|uniref:redoxin domain-containing protein n=1 Tax=Telluribacter humicola TaxID=1720261 RepID=UPI00286E0C87|nr:redoxin domain-containing protein [Telluribacter humicola]
MAIKKGDKAPSFTLYNTNKKEVTLEDFRGRNLIIHFFPLAFTGTCTTQLCTMRDNLSIYQNLDAEVVGISVDSPFALARYKEDQSYNFDLLSDFNRETSQAYGAY